MANIRSKFKGDKTLDGYQKKKYVCKLLFIFLLGHDIDFGHMEAVNLLSSNKYSEKQIVSVTIFKKNSKYINIIIYMIDKYDTLLLKYFELYKYKYKYIYALYILGLSFHISFSKYKQ